MKKLIKRIVRRLGYSIEKIQSLSDRINIIRKKALRPKERDLAKLSLEIANKKDHYQYDSFLKEFIPSWKDNFKNPVFVGKGYSLSGFNVYRKVLWNDKWLFEKVYYNSYVDLNKVLWFQEYIYPLIKENINIPSIQKVYRGDLLTIVYFDYLDLRKIPKENKHTKTTEITLELFKLSMDKMEQLKELKTPFYIKNYRNHFQYISYSHLLEKRIGSKISVEQIESIIERLPKMISHSDIYMGNIFQNKYLIDWDSFGMYPMGFDPAFTYCRSFVRDDSKDGSLQWLEKNFKRLVPQELWEAFKLSFCYFLMLFSMEYVVNNQINIDRELEENLIDSYNRVK